MTDRDGAGLLRPLFVDDLPPSKVDLDLAVRVGRRRVRTRRALGLGAAAGVTALAMDPSGRYQAGWVDQTSPNRGGWSGTCGPGN